MDLDSRYQNVSILDFIGAKDDGGGGDSWICKTCEAPVTSSPPISNKLTPSFLQAGCPSCRPANTVRALKEKAPRPHSTDLLTPGLPAVFYPCLWLLKAAGYFGGKLPSLSSALRVNYWRHLLRCGWGWHMRKFVRNIEMQKPTAEVMWKCGAAWVGIRAVEVGLKNLGFTHKKLENLKSPNCSFLRFLGSTP